MPKDIVLAIDFDGTITKKNEYPNVGELREECVEVLNKFKELGCILVLWTCRTGKELDDAITFCKDSELPLSL